MRITEAARRLGTSPLMLRYRDALGLLPPVRAAVADLGRRVGRLPSSPERALDFEKERALRLLSGPAPGGTGRSSG